MLRLGRVANVPDIFDHHADFDPAGDFEAFLKSIPGKWAVYLMADANDQPVQLLCVKNLRYSLERRLGTGEPDAGPSRKVNYRDIIRRIHWRRVDSSFEADAVYLEAAREVFPKTYRGMTGMRPAWFVHVNPETTYPRYVKTIDPTGHAGFYFGPIEDKHAAQKLVHHMENLFDLCRDYSILTQSPRGGPCPWKQMGKCVGPCDGTIDLDAYRELVAFSAKVLADPQDYLRQQKTRMTQAAAELRFETAEKIKGFIEQLSQLGKGTLRHVRPLNEFTYVSLQRGPRAGTAKVFLITPGRIDEVAGIIADPSPAGDVLRQVLTLAHDRPSDLDDIGAERIGVVAHHLFQPKAKQGVFIPLVQIDEKSILKAYRDLQNQKPQDEALGEGVTKELQAL
jgi:excinuclease UvrABC nuclease subunit